MRTGWFAHERGQGDGEVSLGEPRVRHKSSAAEPIRIRLMTDDVTGIALWEDEGAREALEDELPISQDLRVRVRQWVDEYTETVGGSNAHWTMDDLYSHDQRGLALSRDLQNALGPGYLITYHFETKRLREEVRERRRREF